MSNVLYSFIVQCLVFIKIMSIPIVVFGAARRAPRGALGAALPPAARGAPCAAMYPVGKILLGN